MTEYVDCLVSHASIHIDGVVGVEFFGETKDGKWIPHSYERMAQLRFDAEANNAELLASLKGLIRSAFTGDHMAEPTDVSLERADAIILKMERKT